MENMKKLSGADFGILFEAPCHITEFCKKNNVIGATETGHTYRLFDGMDTNCFHSYSFDPIAYVEYMKYQSLPFPDGAIDILNS